ncbi:MAG: FkbM family methyltransferase [Pseudomonadota bacterium]
MPTPSPASDRWQLLTSALTPTRTPRVLDIGANPLSNPPYKPLLDAGLIDVCGFEPQADAFAELEAAKGPRETYFPHAVGDGGTHTLHVYRQSGLTSLFKADMETVAYMDRNPGGVTLLDEVSVATKRLDDIADLPKPDLLKIDVQGAEPMIFDNGPDKLSDVLAVVTEVRFFPLYHDDPLMDAQMVALRKLGLHLHKFLFTKRQWVANSGKARLNGRKARSQLLDGDAVFIRDLRQPEALSDDQLAHLALLADGVFQSFDLVIHCLDLLVARGAPADLPDRYIALLPPEVLSPEVLSQ